MSWTEDTIYGLDFETTGVDPTECRTVSVSLIEFKGGECIRALGAVVNSDVEIPDGAAEIHGYTTEKVKEIGRTPEDVFPKLMTVLAGAHKDGAPLCAFNARYDWTLLHAELERLGMDAPPAFNIIDPFIMDKALDKYRKGSRKLTAVAKHYDVPLLAAHTASADALAACGVARQIGRTYPAAGDLTPEELHRKQVLWYLAIKDSFNQYLAKKAKPGEDPDFMTGEWPR